MGRGWSSGSRGRGSGAWGLEGHVEEGSFWAWFAMEISLLLNLTPDTSLVFSLEDP